MAEVNTHLYAELGELAKYLDATLRRLDEAGAPLSNMSSQMPQAASHLEGLTKLTEEGTHEVMRLTEELQDSHALIAGSLGKAATILAKGQNLPCAACVLKESQKPATPADKQALDSRQLLAGALAEAANGLTKGQSGTCIACILSEARQHLTQDDKRLIEIMTALSFQDLVAQRVKKLTTIIHDVERKLLELVVVFGLQHKEGSPEVKSEATDMLKQLEASNATSMKQNLVDDILGKFGFS